ncbi:putative insulin-like peptide beta-type 2 [Caenorhabditis elegans]|uniref:Probable insulin-like peptide beta-type 2 n=1 Tax=Caenorhabditis elegans TaxID=6239 RepID=ILB2_CAEEL|nr:putative insulin-like peptide beta-type 2 [Caenorhabditis elegans]Q09627.1 RecName: Full=Probable insulin-like peptide beta-type 2; Flags: Precursor [Caenorhabditis elegans]CCD61235.1 Probable insulin-like peptide beta-type 2 [Caenorhabditis elegans]|eukprot:NP_495194.1 Probable insulin-like peptide beta-type 2 [Caenorhabditis elegans]
MNAIIFCLLFTTVTATYEVFGKGIEHRNEHLIINQLDIIPVESTPTPNRASRVQKRLCGRRLILFMLATCGECDTDSSEDLSHICCIKQCDVQDIIRVCCPNSFRK